MIVLVHHADAVEPTVDPQRPLSDEGRAHASHLGAQLASRGVRPAALWHSGKLRARQTAEAIWRACNPLAQLTAARGLQPTDPPDWIRDVITVELREVVIVGHMPNLARVLQLLVSGASDGPLTFPPHGAVALERDGERWVELWRME